MVVAASEDRSNFGKAQVFQNKDLTTVAAQLPNNVWKITSTDYGSRDGDSSEPWIHEVTLSAAHEAVLMYAVERLLLALALRSEWGIGCRLASRE